MHEGWRGSLPAVQQSDTATQFDLIIVGSGSGNSIPEAMEGWRIALVEKGVFGGTCLNRGCIPSKMFVHAAELAASVPRMARLGVHATLDRVDWPGIVDRVFGRIDPIAAGGEEYRRERCDNVTVFAGTARFVDRTTVDVDGVRISAPKILLAAGARPDLPAIDGLASVPFHTSDTVMRLRELPRRMIVLGGGFIAAELGHVFGSFGVEVTFVVRGPRMLRDQDESVSIRATEEYGRRFGIVTGATPRSVRQEPDGTIVLTVSQDGTTRDVVGDVLLVATGRVPNGDVLEVARAGVPTDGTGRRVLTDEYLRTPVDGIWAIGDLTNEQQLKHLANAEAKAAFWNILHADDPSVWRRIDRRHVPWAVFGSPQIAGVGLREQDLVGGDVPYVVATKDYGATAYGWAMEDGTSFCKVIAHRDDRTLLGAHIIGPQASTLIQPLVQAMQFGQTVDRIARDVWYIHPALTEVVENALLDL